MTPASTTPPIDSVTTTVTAASNSSPSRLSPATRGCSTKPSNSAKASGIRIARPKHSAAMITAAVVRPTRSLIYGIRPAKASLGGSAWDEEGD